MPDILLPPTDWSSLTSHVLGGAVFLRLLVLAIALSVTFPIWRPSASPKSKLPPAKPARSFPMEDKRPRYLAFCGKR